MISLNKIFFKNGYYNKVSHNMMPLHTLNYILFIIVSIRVAVEVTLVADLQGADMFLEKEDISCD